MSQLIVLTFDNMDEAHQVREALSRQEHAGMLALNDSAVIVKDQDGKVHVHNEMDRGVKVGAVGGGLLGILVGFIFFPIGGMLLGAAAGAIIGKMVDPGVDKKFVKDVTEALTPGTSAIFMIVRDDRPDAVIGVLSQFKGHLYQTTLDSEAEASLRSALSDKA